MPEENYFSVRSSAVFVTKTDVRQTQKFLWKLRKEFPNQKFKDKNWQDKVERYKLDPTLNWKLSEITSFNNNEIRFKIFDKKDNKNEKEGIINQALLKLTLDQSKMRNDFFVFLIRARLLSMIIQH